MTRGGGPAPPKFICNLPSTTRRMAVIEWQLA